MALTSPTTSPGKATSTVSRSAPKAVIAYFVVRSRPVRAQVTVIPRSKRPEQIRANARRSRCAGSMFAWTLNTKAEKPASSGRDSPSSVSRGAGRRREVDDGVEDHPHAEVGQRRADEHGRRVAGEERRHVDVGTDGVEQGQLVDRRRPVGALARRPPRRARRPPPGRARRRARCGRSGCRSPARRSMTPRSSPADPDRPRRRRRPQTDLRLDLVEQLERFATGTVVLVEERQHRQAAAPAHLEQLERLGLDALGAVEHHHHGVDAGEHPVGVLGEVLVAGRVEEVDHVVAVGELQHGRADRDAPLALQLHPVRRRRPSAFAGLDGTGTLHRAGVEQELLGQRGLAGVGVADDRERPPAGRFGEHVGARVQRWGGDIHGRSTLSGRIRWQLTRVPLMVDNADRITVEDNEAENRYEALADGEVVGFARYVTPWWAHDLRAHRGRRGPRGRRHRFGARRRRPRCRTCCRAPGRSVVSRSSGRTSNGTPSTPTSSTTHCWPPSTATDACRRSHRNG